MSWMISLKMKLMKNVQILKKFSSKKVLKVKI